MNLGELVETLTKELDLHGDIPVENDEGYSLVTAEAVRALADHNDVAIVLEFA